MKKKVKTSSLPFVFLSFPGLTGINRDNGQAIKASPKTEQSKAIRTQSLSDNIYRLFLNLSNSSPLTNIGRPSGYFFVSDRL